jgi:hypothetical protein
VAAAIKLSGAAGAKETYVFRAIAALALASASTHPTATLTTSASWWERITVTVSGDGQTHSCRYETSLQAGSGDNCGVAGDAAALAKIGGAKDQYTRITFERRFSPGAKVEAAALQPGETLLGGQVMALAIDPRGAVKNCRIVATSGALTPQYGCDEAAAERFDASAGEHARAEAREGYMSILVYGHSEHVV